MDRLRTQSAYLELPSTSCTYHCPHIRRRRCISRETSIACRISKEDPARLSYRASSARSCTDLKEQMPLFVSLDKDVMKTSETLAYMEALSAGLRALKVLGITGIAVDIHWGLVEGAEPGIYNWTGYRALVRLISDFGFKIKVSLCFHSTDNIPLPEWIVREGRVNPDIFYTDKAGGRNTECLTLGVNDVPVLRGRMGVEVYTSFMLAFKDEFKGWFGSTISECLIGLGPNSELRYPSHPSDKRWNFPGIGEFQCYDRFMLATLKACADQVNQPSWGLGGPHDAGSYCIWPHQTGFFHQHGSWNTPYGHFFMQWYSEMLARHANDIVNSASSVFEDCNVQLSVRIPGHHWWYNTASHAPEMTAGYYNTVQRDGYLPIFKALSQHGVSLRLNLAELRNTEQPQQAFCDPEKLLVQQRTVAAALRMPVDIENKLLRFDDQALQRLESVLFDNTVNQSVELPQPTSMIFNCMTDAMFEPANWRSFKSFVIRVRDRAQQNPSVGPGWPTISMDGGPGLSKLSQREQPIFA
ncbi:hypothetical protein CEUSTIGMA_g549.t1 [Chlamydomonas eustigma]|uniref:Beta-amylase n=1 Tax=Chlamydomonas eustigma TaxID=1157962 RepID=A0A250WQX5_9CHLO|nr:hypothetical protein CEUSTIGMA_g549.t1 [Chlamydomonas eustigma]|eukprot:GAX73096.1 hypothetical protein CEUSTIGMA_g549.t1 [Chlamydomonas eustigma]